MTDSYWSGLGVAAGTAITTGNVNTVNNSDAALHSHSVVYSVSVSPTATFERPAAPAGPGLSITGVATDIGRLDLTQVTTDGGACQVIYTPSGVPTTSNGIVIMGRSAAANSAQVAHNNTTSTLEFRDAGGTASSVTNGISPAVVNGHSYQIDIVVALNTVTPTTSNGRIIGRVLGLTDPTWNGNGEFFVDTAYTENVGTAQITAFRVGKVNSPSINPQAYYTGIRWGERIVDTSSDPAVARAQFVQVVAPYNPPTDIPTNIPVDPASASQLVATKTGVYGPGYGG
jgi:hypothetical protein